MMTIEGVQIELGNYKGLTAAKPEASVSEAELAAAFQQQQKASAQKADVSGRAVRLGDIAVIDFAGYRNGELFEGGSGTDYPLEIGSGTFIPGFEEQLVGAEIGAETDVNVTVKKIQEYRYSELSDEEKKAIGDKLRAQREQACEEQFESALIRQIVGGSTIEVTEVAMARESETMLKEWKALMRMNRIDPDQYYQMTGLNDQKIKEQLRTQTEQRLRSRIAMEAVAQAEGIEASEDEVEAELEEMARQYNLPKETVREKLDDSHFQAMKSNIRVRRAMALIKENANR